jgi:hypothetical protein
MTTCRKIEVYRIAREKALGIVRMAAADVSLGLSYYANSTLGGVGFC